MSITKARAELAVAESVDAIGFYTSTSTNRGPEINCRLWDGFRHLSNESAEQLCRELNSAIKSTKEAWSKQAKDAARKTLDAM